MHEGGYRVDPDGRFFYPWRGEILASPSLPHGDPRQLAVRNRRFMIDSETCKHVSGERMDLAAAVDSLLTIRDRSKRGAGAGDRLELRAEQRSNGVDDVSPIASTAASGPTSRSSKR